MSRSPIARRPSSTHHLRVLPGGDGDPPRGLVRAAQRPGDRHDAWPVDALRGPFLEEIRSQAAGERVSAELAVSLVLQRCVAVDDLRAAFGRDLPRLISALDRAAADAKVEQAVSPAYAAYVRELTARVPRCAPAAAMVPLPVRVIERLAGGVPAVDEGTVDVAAAVAWERASALGGQTMAEWAALWAARISRT